MQQQLEVQHLFGVQMLQHLCNVWQMCSAKSLSWGSACAGMCLQQPLQMCGTSRWITPPIWSQVMAQLVSPARA